MSGWGAYICPILKCLNFLEYNKRFVVGVWVLFQSKLSLDIGAKSNSWHVLGMLIICIVGLNIL